MKRGRERKKRKDDGKPSSKQVVAMVEIVASLLSIVIPAAMPAKAVTIYFQSDNVIACVEAYRND